MKENSMQNFFIASCFTQLDVEMRRGWAPGTWAVQSSAFEYRGIGLLREKIIFLIGQWPVHDNSGEQKALEMPQAIYVHVYIEDHWKIVFSCLYLKLYCFNADRILLVPWSMTFWLLLACQCQQRSKIWRFKVEGVIRLLIWRCGRVPEPGSATQGCASAEAGALLDNTGMTPKLPAPSFARGCCCFMHSPACALIHWGSSNVFSSPGKRWQSSRADI